MLIVLFPDSSLTSHPEILFVTHPPSLTSTYAYVTPLRTLICTTYFTPFENLTALLQILLLVTGQDRATPKSPGFGMTTPRSEERLE